MHEHPVSTFSHRYLGVHSIEPRVLGDSSLSLHSVSVVGKGNQRMKQFLLNFLYLILTAFTTAAFVYIIVTYTPPAIWILVCVLLMLIPTWLEKKDIL
jgi:hypothetical protein